MTRAIAIAFLFFGGAAMITAAITRNTRQMMERERGNTGVKTGIPADIYEAIGQRKTDLQAMKPG